MPGLPERHLLNQGQIHASAMRKHDEIIYIPFKRTAHRHGTLLGR